MQRYVPMYVCTHSCTYACMHACIKQMVVAFQLYALIPYPINVAHSRQPCDYAELDWPCCNGSR